MDLSVCRWVIFRKALNTCLLFMLPHLSILWAVINISCSPEIRECHPWPQQGSWGTEGRSDLCTIMQWLWGDTEHWTKCPESFLTVWMPNFTFIIAKPRFSFLCKWGWRGGSGDAAQRGGGKEELKAVTDQSKCQWKLRASEIIAKAVRFTDGRFGSLEWKGYC